MVAGRVVAFDDRRGDGEMVTDDGESLYFHCVGIADGSRTIAVGTPVRADRVVGHRGHDEASNLVAESRR